VQELGQFLEYAALVFRTGSAANMRIGHSVYAGRAVVEQTARIPDG
jgi:hypothetical protein